MTNAQQYRLELIDRSNVITEEDKAALPGVHFCPDCDEMPIFDDSPEKSQCRCDL